MLHHWSAAAVAVCLLLLVCPITARQLDDNPHHHHIQDHQLQQPHLLQPDSEHRVADHQAVTGLKGRSLSYHQQDWQKDERQADKYGREGGADMYGREGGSEWDQGMRDRHDVGGDRAEVQGQQDGMRETGGRGDNWQGRHWADRDQSGSAVAGRFYDHVNDHDHDHVNDHVGGDRFQDRAGFNVEDERNDGSRFDRRDEIRGFERSDRYAWEKQDQQPWQQQQQYDSRRERDAGAWHPVNARLDGKGAWPRDGVRQDARDDGFDHQQDYNGYQGYRDARRDVGRDVGTLHRHDHQTVGQHTHDHSWRQDSVGGANGTVPHGDCGTANLSPEEMAFLEAKLDEAKQWWEENKDEVQAWIGKRFSSVWKEIKNGFLDSSRSDGEQGSIPTVPVYFHILTIKDDSGNKVGSVSEDQLNAQIEALNNAYAPMGLAFSMADHSTYTVDSKYFTACNDDSGTANDLKSQLRNSNDATDLNVYTWDLTDCRGNSGFATFPPDKPDEAVPRTDGVVSNYKTFPGGEWGLGVSVVHEVGHWLGAYHTFQDGCDANNDYVSDTPAQAKPTEGCPEVGEDSCGEGPELVHNIMNYAPHSCRKSFTQGQYEKMVKGWNLRVEIDYKHSN